MRCCDLRRKDFRRATITRPFPDFDALAKDDRGIFSQSPTTLGGIDLNDDAQTELFHEMIRADADLPISDQPQSERRFYFQNDFFGRMDGTVLWCLLNHLRPKRVIEVGSGFSSALMLDAAETVPMPDLELTFIEPEPERLRSLLRGDDRDRVTIHECGVQEIDVSVFEQLQGGDVLFIDGSHVSKIGSDVNFVVFEVLPRLKPGIWIHFHDVFFPFEYPKHWVVGERRAWNEAYLLRALLMDSRRLKIRFWNHYFSQAHHDVISAKCEKLATGSGGSIWLQTQSGG